MNSKTHQRIQGEVINRIKTSLNSGEKFHWVRPWDDMYVWPRNYQSGCEYKGVNMLLLSHQGGEYLTYKQIQELNKKDPNVKLRKGATGKPIIYFQLKEIKDENGNIVLDDDNKPKTYPVYKIYYVFHISECDGLETKAPIPRYEHTNEEVKKRCDKVIELFAEKTNLEIQITRGATSAHYNLNHIVSLPDQSQFESLYDYYHTAFHELVHSCLHNRKALPTEYARGELEAEIGASALCNLLEIPFDGKPDNDVAYLQSWMKHIKGNKESLLLTASVRAFKAIDEILDENELKKALEFDEKKEKLQSLIKNQSEFHVSKITINNDER